MLPRVTLCLLCSFIFLSNLSSFAQEVKTPLGIMVGEVTDSSAFAQVRLSASDKLINRYLPGAEGVVHFMIHGEGDNTDSKILKANAVSEHDFIARVGFTNLKPGSTYYIETLVGPDDKHLQGGPSASFKTLPGKNSDAPVKFVVVTGMNYAKFHGDSRIDKKQHLIENNTKLPDPYSGIDKPLGYPALAAIVAKRPAFFVGTGDNVYYDTPDKPRAESMKDCRQKWHEQWIQPRYVNLFSKVPTYWEIDDHDYRIDDGDNTGDHHPTPEEGRALMLEQLPVADQADTDAKTYRTHRVNKDLQIWMPENRMYRSPNADPDGPEKTIWGKEQKEWLMKTLKESDATFKVLISPTPMVGPDDLRKFDNHTNVNGFQHERNEFFAWLKKSGVQKNFYIVCGDRHWQYHALDSTGIEEFSCGALIDPNSRLGRKPGDPEGTDPKGLIKHIYYQTPRSGGFLQVSVAPKTSAKPSSLSFDFFEEHGKLLYQEVKLAK